MAQVTERMKSWPLGNWWIMWQIKDETSYLTERLRCGVVQGRCHASCTGVQVDMVSLMSLLHANLPAKWYRSVMADSAVASHRHICSTVVLMHEAHPFAREGAVLAHRRKESPNVVSSPTSLYRLWGDVRVLGVLQEELYWCCVDQSCAVCCGYSAYGACDTVQGLSHVQDTKGEHTLLAKEVLLGKFSPL